MSYKWNKEGIHRHYDRVKRQLLEEGYSEEELARPDLCRLSKQTKSPRILGMIRLAYSLGMLRGIKDVDEGLTPIGLDSFEMNQLEGCCKRVDKGEHESTD